MSSADDNNPVPEGGQPLYLACEPDPVLAFAHMPADASRQSTAVLICPPFGWEEMCSYRARRAWAYALAKAGYPALRIDLPGAGDSGGLAADPGRLDAWTGAVATAAGWLRETSGCERLVAIGIGLGGMVAYRAAAQGAGIDDLILWAVPSRGRRLVRELQAYAGVVAARYPAEVEDPPKLPEGAVEVTGFLLNAETVRELSELDLSELDLPEAKHRRVLMIERDGLGVDKRLLEHLHEQEAPVTVSESHDYGALMAHPQHARMPDATIDYTLAWLAETPAEPPSERHGAAPAPASLTRDSIELHHDGVAIRESPLELRGDQGRLFGVLSEPSAGADSPVSAVLLNSGAIRRIGPNRTWVEIARSWAARGVPTVRIDLAGIGDSDGDERPYVRDGGLYSPAMSEQVRGVLAGLRQRDLPARFVLVGLCSGAYWALHTSLAEPSVAGALMINLYAFEWSEALVAERDRRETVAALRTGVLRRLAHGRVTRHQIRRAVRSIHPRRVRHPRGGSVETTQAADVDAALNTLRDQGTQALLLLSTGEPLYDQFVRERRLERLGEWPNLRVERIPSSDHMSRAIWLQDHVAARLDAALERVIAAEPAHPLEQPQAS